MFAFLSKTRRLLPVFYLLAACTTPGQEEGLRDSDAYAVSSSLSSSQVTSFGEDASGHIWIGTADGLNRYNGKEFYQYFRVDEPYALSNNYIRSFMTDSQGRFWLATNGGACFYNDRDAFTQTQMDVNFRGILSMTESVSGDIIIYNFAGNLLVLDEEELSFHTVPFSTEITQCSSIHALPDGTVLLVSNEALYQVDYHSGTVLQTIPWPGEGASLSKRAEQDGTGHLFCYGNHFLECLDLSSLTFIPLPQWMSPLAEQNISLMYFKDTRAFIVAGDGLWYHDAASGRLYAPGENGPYRLSEFLPSCLYLDSRDILWAGSASKGFIRLPASGILFNRDRTMARRLQEHPVSDMAWDGDDGLWLLSENKLYRWMPPGTLQNVSPAGPDESYQAIACHAEDGRVWVARHWDVFSFRYEEGQVTDLKEYRLQRRVSRLICGPDGTAYAGTYYKGLFRIEPGSGRITTLREPVSDLVYGQAGNVYDMVILKSGELAATLFREDIEIYDPATGRHRVLPYRDQIRELVNLECLLEDRDGTIWFGSRDYGLYKYTPDGICSQQEGLRFRGIRSLAQAPDGHIWVGTAHGLCMVNPDSGSVLNFTASNGIGGNEFYARSACVLPDGTVALGGHHGITTCHPVPLPDDQAAVPVVFESLKVENKTVFPSENGTITDLMWNNPPVRLRYNQNNIAVSFALLDYQPHTRPSFRFKLDGHDKEWTQIGDATTVFFSRLRPGRYLLHVDAELAGGGEAIESILPIQVRPPLWGTWFAKLLYLLGFISLISIFIAHSRRKLRYELQLQQSEREKEHEREMNRMNLNFFGNLAHEFRSPLTLLEGPLKQLRERDNLDGQEHRLLDAMQSSTRRMHRLVNQIIDYNKADTGGLVLQAAPGFDLSSYLRNFLQINEVTAKARDVEIDAQGISAPVLLPLDEDKFESILLNLISNAFKFVRQDGGLIRLRLSSASAQELAGKTPLRQEDLTERYVTLDVENNGLPIDPAELEHVFDRYYQLREHGKNTKRVGSGIGLSFARTLAVLHHGYLWAENLPDGQGVRFTLALPADSSPYREDELLDPAAAPQAPEMPRIRVEVSRAGESPAAHRARVLVVDDDIDIANYIAMILGGNYDVQVCYSAGQALDKLRSSAIPDIVLSDVMMPDIDGIELCKTFKSNSLTRQVPFLLITAKTGTDFQVEGLESGADAYITKPFDPAYLRAQVKSLLKNRVLASGEIPGIADMLSIDTTSLNEGDRAFLSEIGGIIQNNVNDPDLDVSELARRMKMSRSKLFYRIKEVAGMSPNDLIRRYRLEQAARLLREGRINVSEAAYTVGFSSLSHFSRSFKDYFGILPKDVSRK